MPIEPKEHFRWYLEDGVAIIEVLTSEFNYPRFAEEFGDQVRALMATHPADRVVVNFGRTKSMSSTAFSSLFEMWKAASASGVQVAFCGMSPLVRLGADILCLGEYAPIFDDEATAVAALKKG